LHILSGFVSLALIIQQAQAPYYIATCDLSSSTTFFSHYLINGTIFVGKKLLNTMCMF